MQTAQSYYNINRRFINYILLNASFNERIGLFDGKAGAILFISSNRLTEAAEWIESISVSLLEETISQINIFTPLNFGTGVAGIGVLIEHLSQRGLLEVNTSDLLEEVEPHLLRTVYECKLDTLGLASGISGFGMYFFLRLNAVTPVHAFQTMRYKESLIACVDRVSYLLEFPINSLPSDLSIKDGLSGVLLFLQKVRLLKIYEPFTTQLIRRVSETIIEHLTTDDFSWTKVQAWFSLLYTSLEPHFSVLRNSTIFEFKRFVEEAETRLADLDFHEAAFVSMWLRLIAFNLQIGGSVDYLSKKTQEYAEEVLNRDSLNVHFSYISENKSVNIGLDRGVSGMSLPLLSMQTGDYKWLGIFGISV